MQKLHLWIVLLVVQISLSAQVNNDTIITLQNDTIICLISRTDSNYIYFTNQSSNSIDNSFVSIKKVRKYVYDGESYVCYSLNTSNSYPQEWQDKRLRIGINGGYSKRVAENPPGIDAVLTDYYDDSKSGGHFGVDFAWYFNYKSGIGVKYSLYKSSTTPIDIWLELENGDVITGKMQENVKINYYGICYSFKINSINNKSWFYGDAGLGICTYNNRGKLIDDFIMNSGTFGYNIDIGYDFGLTESTRLGLQVSFYAGVLTYVDVTMNGSMQTLELDASSYESIARVDLGVALRFVR